MLVSRTSVVSCDERGGCDARVELRHDLSYEGDSGYPFNRALDEAGWSNPFDRGLGSYVHLCPQHAAPRRELLERRKGGR